MVINLIIVAIGLISVWLMILIKRILKTRAIYGLFIAVIYGSIIRIAMIFGLPSDIAAAAMVLFWCFLTLGIFGLYKALKSVGR